MLMWPIPQNECFCLRLARSLIKLGESPGYLSMSSLDIFVIIVSSSGSILSFDS